jgi:hypothetical protein
MDRDMPFVRTACAVLAAGGALLAGCSGPDQAVDGAGGGITGGAGAPVRDAGPLVSGSGGGEAEPFDQRRRYIETILDQQASGALPRRSADRVRSASGVDGLPEGLRPVVDAKIAKKLRATPTTGAAEAAAFFLHQRLKEGQDYPINRVHAIARREAEQAARIRRIERDALLRGSPSTALGTADPIIDGWRAIGPGNVGGRTRALVISPNGPGTGEEGDEGFMLAAGVSGGVFKSTDAGASWGPTSDLLENIAVCSLVMDPTDPSIVYAGTGEGFQNGGAVRGLGIFKSTDAGETWAQLEETTTPFVAPFAFHYVNKLAISPSDPNRIYAATRSGVWIHENAGEPTNEAGDEFAWDLVLGNPFFQVGSQNSEGSAVGATDIQVRPAPASGVADPVDEEIVLASFGSFVADGLFISADGGGTWFRAIDEVASEEEQLYRIDSPYQGRMSIAFSARTGAGDEGVAYVLMARNADFFTPTDEDDPALLLELGSVVSVFRADLAQLDVERDGDGNVTSLSLPFEARFESVSTINDANKVLLSNPLVSGACAASVFPALSQGWYDNIIKVDPANRNVVWAGGVDLFRSDDGGRNFGLASYWYFGDGDDQYVHADQHEIVFHPEYDGSSNATMYVTNDGGIFRTDDAFKPVAGDLCPFPDDPDDEPMISTVTFESLNNGYEVTQFYHGDTGTSVTDGRDVFIGGTQDNGTVRSFTRFCTEGWDSILGGDGGYVAINPLDNDIVYAETQNFGNIFRRTVSGNRERVESLRGTPPLSTRDTGLFITPLAMDPNNPRVLWTGGFRPWRTLNAQISADFVVWNAGADLNIAGLPGFFDIVGRVSAIAVSPTDSDIVYMGTEDGYIARTGDGTATTPTWSVISAGLPIEEGFISSIAVDPVDPNSVWVTNARFTEFDPNDPTPEFNLYKGTCAGDCDDPDSWFFLPMDGADCDPDDGIDPVLPDVPAHWVAIRRCGTGACAPGDCLVFVGTEIGVYVSEDAYSIDEDCAPVDGQPGVDSVTWRLLNIGDDETVGVMPTTVVETLDFRDDNTIVAFTHGRGAFVANILRECEGVPQGAPCSPADIAAPFGVLDNSDLLAMTQEISRDTEWRRLFADMPGEGEDCGDGIVDLNDLNRFVAIFQAGCP